MEEAMRFQTFGIDRDDLKAFVRESNKIEGIRGATNNVVDAHAHFLAIPAVQVSDLIRLVSVLAPGKPLRQHLGMNVRVGDHIPPPGGPHIPEALEDVLRGTRVGEHPWNVHRRYETLHPFMDGNGRSGRALWLWQMLRDGDDPWALKRGFLHTFYYQTLSRARP